MQLAITVPFQADLEVVFNFGLTQGQAFEIIHVKIMLIWKSAGGSFSLH